MALSGPVRRATYYNFPFGVNIKVHTNRIPTAENGLDQDDPVCEEKMVAYIR
jgi:hypothetical protein